jgi:hypothetical protein
MPDFDFDTRKPQEPAEPNKHRTLLIATRSRILLIANRVRNLLIATRLRTLLIGGGILWFVMVAIPVGVFIYSASELGTETVPCDLWYLGKERVCVDPGGATEYAVCKANSRDEVAYSKVPCKQPPAPSPNFLENLGRQIV